MVLPLLSGSLPGRKLPTCHVMCLHQMSCMKSFKLSSMMPIRLSATSSGHEKRHSATRNFWMRHRRVAVSASKFGKCLNHLFGA